MRNCYLCRRKCGEHKRTEPKTLGEETIRNGCSAFRGIIEGLEMGVDQIKAMSLYEIATNFLYDSLGI